MSKRLNLLAGAALALSLSNPVQAQDASADTVVATVNGVEITLGHMILVRAGLPDQYSQLPNEVLFDGILNQLVQQQVLAAEAPETTPRRVELALDNERRTLMAAEAIDDKLGADLTDEAIQAAYDAQYGDAGGDTEWNASHILVATEEEAQALVEELNGGADFAELARENSTGPSGPNGGSLGWFGTGMMVPAFEEAVATLESGAVSAPVQTQFGWHVIKLNETRTADAPALEDVRGQIEQELSASLVDEYLNELTEAADVDRSGAEGLDPELLGQIDLLQR